MLRVFHRVVLLVALFATSFVPAAFSQNYRITDQTFSIPGSGNIGAMMFYGKDLYIARGSQLIMLDTREGAERGHIDDLPAVDGIAFNFDLDRGFLSSFQDSSVTLFDTRSLKTVGRPVKLNKAPVAIVTVQNRTYLLAIGEDMTQIDARSGDIMSTVPLGGLPAAVDYDFDGYVFVALPSAGKVAVIDAGLVQKTYEYQVPKCPVPRTISVNKSTDHVYVGCDDGRLSILRFKDDKLSEIGSVKKICDHIHGSSVDSVEALFVGVCQEGAISFVEEHQERGSGRFEYRVYKLSTQQKLDAVTVISGEKKRILVTAENGDAKNAGTLASGSDQKPSPQSAILVLAR